MNRFDTNPFEAELQIVATMRDKVILASIAQAEIDSEFKEMVRAAARSGIDIDSLSDASGLTPDQIRALVFEVFA